MPIWEEDELLQCTDLLKWYEQLITINGGVIVRSELILKTMDLHFKNDFLDKYDFLTVIAKDTLSDDNQ